MFLPVKSEHWQYSVPTLMDTNIRSSNQWSNNEHDTGYQYDQPNRESVKNRVESTKDMNLRASPL